MAPSGLAILLGAGPTTGAGIARVLARPSQGNLAVALLSRSGDAALADRLSQEAGGGVLKAFQSDTTETSLNDAFREVRTWAASLVDGGGLKLQLAIWSIKHSHKTAFEDETSSRFGDSLQVYVTGAMVFSQLALKWFLDQYPDDNTSVSGAGDPGSGEEHEMVKKGTLIFTGTLGALRTNPGYAAYGAGRAGVRMLAQSLAREYSARGVHVVHAIANGGIVDADASSAADGDDAATKEKRAKVLLGEKIRAESVGRLYLDCMRQSCDLWVHELDMRPAREKF
ncbi:short-chain dehydrogenase/reductase SDR [Cladophialophora carrionii]|uniref:Short-chain dehydrogenase/reductase SDR n=1 Tax=Cladophialophora carrionii TaxID=86049 RepID=A0A1C1CDH8_9EURO|nr:short-chain dehydrogenase/reductase SDR [Cladophialophora carrionii]